MSNFDDNNFYLFEDRYLENTFLIPGNSLGNYVFFGCADEFFNTAKDSLSRNKSKIPAVCVNFGQKDIEIIEPFFKHFSSIRKRLIIAQTYVDLKMLLSFFTCYDKMEIPLFKRASLLKSNAFSGYSLFLSQNVDAFPSFYSNINIDANIIDMIKGTDKKIELNIFEKNMSCKELQKAINNYLSKKSTYPIKLFTTNTHLCDNTDVRGHFIDSKENYKIQSPFIIHKKSLSDM